MAGPVVNPLDMDCIIEKVLDYVQPSLLQPCRLVNHTWNQLTTSRMKKAGWVLNLSSERLEEYLRILEATERNRGGPAHAQMPEISERSRMEIRLHLKISPDSRGMKELDTAIKILRHLEVPKIVSLQLEYVKARHTSEPITLEERRARLDELITGIGISIRELTIRLNNGDNNVDWILSAFPKQPNVFIPNLEAISVEFTDIESAQLVPEVVDQVVRHAKEENLRRLNLFPNGNIASLVDGHYSPHNERSRSIATATLLSLTSCHNICSSLLELNLHLVCIDLLRFVDTLHFDQLRILRVSDAKPDDIFAFVRTNCPILNTLEFVDCALAFQPRQDEFPNLKQLGLYRRCDSRLSNAAFLMTLAKCPNVTTVNTNFTTWLELTTWFTHSFGDVDLQGEGQDFVLWQPGLNIVLPTVSTLGIDTPQSSVLLDPDDRHRQIMCWFIRRMFSNLTKLVIDLNPGMETPLLQAGPTEEWQHRKLCYILGLVFRVPSLKHVEMKNVDNQWHLPPPMTLQPDAPVVPPAPPSALESLTIQAAPKSYSRGIATDSHHDADASSPKLDLDSLLSALPAQCPALVLQIDARLLLNFRTYDHTDYEHRKPIYPHKPYERLVEDLKARTNPRIQLI